MGNYVNKIVTKYIPNTLFKMKYDQYNDLITLIISSKLSKIYTISGHALRSCKQQSESVTYMRSAIINLRKIINESKCKYFRIFTLSDGISNDQIETLNEATKLAKEINGKYIIRSSTIKLFTNTQLPDTRRIASLLQLNNCNNKDSNTKLIDFQVPSISGEFENVFSNALADNLGLYIQLASSIPIFMTDPWSNAKSEIYLSEGINTF